MSDTITCEQFARNLIDHLGLNSENSWEILPSIRDPSGFVKGFLMSSDQDEIFETIGLAVRELSFEDAIQVWYTCTVTIELCSPIEDYNDKLDSAHLLAIWSVYHTLKELIPAPELPKLETTNTP
jgi:hypothetical protein